MSTITVKDGTTISIRIGKWAGCHIFPRWPLCSGCMGWPNVVPRPERYSRGRHDREAWADDQASGRGETRHEWVRR